MELKNFASKIVAENNFIKASFGGFAGSGKTRTATELIIGCYKKMGLKKPVLFIDNEKGSRFLIPLFEKAGIEVYVKETTQLADILASFDLLQSKEVDFLFMDSLTKVWYQFVRDYKQANRKTFMTLQDWGKILPDWQEKFADRFVSLTGNCVFTGRGGYTYDMEENEDTKKKEFVKSGVKMKMAGETPFEPDLNIWMEAQQELNQDGKPSIWREALILKDRSGLIDGKTFKNPTFNDFEPVLDYLMNVKKGDVSKETFNNNLASSENFENLSRIRQREIENEKIKSLFDLYKFGTSKEDKQLKAMILQKIFKTTSATEIENMSFEFLQNCRMELDVFFQKWAENLTIETQIKYIENYQLSIQYVQPVKL